MESVVGTLGYDGDPFPHWSRTLTFPALKWGRVLSTLDVTASAPPPSMVASAREVPLWGNATNVNPFSIASISAFRCTELPIAEVAIRSLPGLAFAHLIIPSRSFQGALAMEARGSDSSSVIRTVPLIVSLRVQLPAPTARSRIGTAAKTATSTWWPSLPLGRVRQ